MISKNNVKYGVDRPCHAFPLSRSISDELRPCAVGGGSVSDIVDVWGFFLIWYSLVDSEMNRVN